MEHSRVKIASAESSDAIGGAEALVDNVVEQHGSLNVAASASEDTGGDDTVAFPEPMLSEPSATSAVSQVAALPKPAIRSSVTQGQAIAAAKAAADQKASAKRVTLPPGGPTALASISVSLAEDSDMDKPPRLPSSASSTESKLDRNRLSVSSKRRRPSISGANVKASISRKMVVETFEVDEEEDVSTKHEVAHLAQGEADDEDYIVLPPFNKHARKFDPTDHSWCCAPRPEYLSQEQCDDRGIVPLWPDNGRALPNAVGLVAFAANTQGDRSYNEDRHRVCYGQGMDAGIRALVGVFDGHGGEESAHYCSEHIEELLADYHARKQPAALEERFLEAVEDMEVQILNESKRVGFTDGTTCCTTLVIDDTLYTVNVGDSRSVLSRGGKAVDLSVDHKPHTDAETRRIELAGGTVEQARKKGFKVCCFCPYEYQNGAYRLWPGGFSVSRALGDIFYKIPDQGLLVPDAEVTVEPISSDDEFVIVASDGFWDTMSSQEAVDSTWKHLKKLDPAEVAQKLVDEAYRKGSDDNITVVLMLFTHHTAIP